MQKRKLGQQGLEVSELGLGCMGMSWAYGTPADESDAIKVLHRSLELGINFWDTAEIYGPFTNEALISKALKGKARDQIVIATKFGFKIENNENVGTNSKPEHVKEAVEGSLKRLGTDYIDLYYQHRLDPEVPIEDTVGAMAELVKAGKVKYIGLSEVGPNTLRRAHAVFPLSALQSEYSLWERTVEEKVLPTVRELGIGFIPYSPLGRGFLSGKLKNLDNLDTKDFRRTNPRFQGENFHHNLALVDVVEEIAAANKVTPGQIALAWLLKQGDDIVPIPGTKRIKYLEENAHAADIKLPTAAWTELNKVLSKFKTAGKRYNEALMKTLNSD
jgi:aryl-alcohol dehydrogenase-like predicted oxidoreductase